MKSLDIYLDESGDLSPYSKTNPFYAVCFVLADDAEACAPALSKFDFDRKKSSLPGVLYTLARWSATSLLTKDMKVG